jgi:hypothetical protein
MAELISATTRGVFRDLMTDSTVGQIEAAFRDGGFAPNPNSTYQDSSIRRETAQAYLESVNWSDSGHVRRFLRVASRLLDGWEEKAVEKLWRNLRSDGIVVGDDGTPTIARSMLDIASIRALADPSAIYEQLERIRRSVEDDPALAIGSAKELIETTAKVVLRERGLPVNETDDLPKLAGQAQTAVGLHPMGSGPDASEGVRQILGAVTTIARGLAELRNRGHGTGHGPATARTGLRPRHAHLAVNAAITWCQLLLDTLTDPEAPGGRPKTFEYWRREAARSAARTRGAALRAERRLDQ